MKRFSFDNTKKIVSGVGNVVVGAGQASLAATWGYGVTNTQQGKSTVDTKKDIQANQDKKLQDIATAGIKAAQDSFKSIGLGIENKAAMNVAGAAGGSGGGHGTSQYVPGLRLGQFVPNVGGGGLLNLSGGSIQPFSPVAPMGPSLYQNNTKSINPSQSIVVQNVNINVETSGLSSDDVADAVYDKFVSQVNRLSRVPSVNRL